MEPPSSSARPEGAPSWRYVWRVPRKVPLGKLAVAAIIAALTGVGATQWWQYATAAVVVAGVALWAVRDLAVPVRLVANADELGVVGFLRRHRLRWDQVERVRVDVRRRSRMLEVDIGEHLYLFSRYDVDADLDEIASQLEALRTTARH